MTWSGRYVGSQRMDISPAAGKILGMLMAYAVSALGLLLAYYNYRKRIVRAEQVFTPRATKVIVGVITTAIFGMILGAAALQGDGGWQGLIDNWVGIVVPVAIFAVSFGLTWLLYRHFAAKSKG